MESMAQYAKCCARYAQWQHRKIPSNSDEKSEKGLCKGLW